MFSKLVRHSIAVIGLGIAPWPALHPPVVHRAAVRDVHDVRDASDRAAASTRDFMRDIGVPAGSYVAVQANGTKLPWTTQVPAVKGLVHWARLDLAVLRLSADGRYTLSYRYAQDVIDSRAPLKMPPARDELSVGRYSDHGRTLTFVPNRTPQGRERSVTAQIVGPDIFLDKTVFVGERPFRVRLLFRRDPSLW